jgi:hypothetical protein
VKRLAKFIRSVIPADPTQLLLLAGAICLTFSPHLKFWPPAFVTQPDHPTQLLIEQTGPLRIFFVWFVMFLLIAIYTSRLAFGIARLPLSLPDSPSSEATDSAHWRQLQYVI